MKAIRVLGMLLTILAVAGCGKTDKCFSDYKWDMPPSKVHEIAEGKGYELSGRQICKKRPIGIPIAMEGYYIVENEIDKEQHLAYKTTIAGAPASIFFFFGTSPKSDFIGLSKIGISWENIIPDNDKYQELKSKYPDILESKKASGTISSIFFISKEAKAMEEKAVKHAAEESGISEGEWRLKDINRSVDQYLKQKGELDKLK